jgi:hypothetical protein
MLPYLFYYFIAFSIFLLPSKYKPIFFSILWFVFIGFRDGIGVDYFSTLKTIERQVIDFKDISISFQGYNFFDAEIVYKIFATFFAIFNINVVYVLTFIAFVESIFIYHLIKNAKNKNFVIFIFVSIFSLHYPMNAMRQGFCLLSLIFSNSYFKEKSSANSILFYIFSLISHYASIPIILLSRIKLDFRVLSAFIISLFVIYLLLDIDTLMSRYSIDQIDAFTFKGNGLKLYLFTFLFIFFNNYILNKKIYDYENILIVVLFIATIKFNPVFRLYFFYLYYKVISECYKLDYSRISGLKKSTALIIPLLLFLFEWQEIFRFQPCLDCGDWLPYKTILF